MLFSRNLIDVTGKQVHKWWIHIYADPSVPHHPKSSCRCPSLKSFRDINKQIDTICRIWKKTYPRYTFKLPDSSIPRSHPSPNFFAKGSECLWWSGWLLDPPWPLAHAHPGEALHRRPEFSRSLKTRQHVMDGFRKNECWKLENLIPEVRCKYCKNTYCMLYQVMWCIYFCIHTQKSEVCHFCTYRVAKNICG